MPGATTTPMGAAIITALVASVTLLVFMGLFALASAVLPTRHVPAASPKEDRYQVLVLGDLGRSPRMQYHALSIVKSGARVDLVGYRDSELHPGLVDNPRVGVYPVSPMPQWPLPNHVLRLVFKAVWQSFNLFQVLAYRAPAAKWIIVQNPPSIPTLHIAYLVAWLRGSKLMVDWHNYGYTIMAVARGRDFAQPLVRLYQRYEAFFGRVVPDVSITVTEAMAADLKGPGFKLEMPIVTMHDRPAGIFRPIAFEEKRLRFLSKLAETKDCAESIMKGETRLLVSSTSWTPDEDLGMFLEALLQYGGSDAASYSSTQHEAELKATAKGHEPLLVIITGKGPQKAAFENKVAALKAAGNLPLVNIKTAWLAMEDYATLLACADLGVCLHESSSQLDLPMKVLDMFGAGLPVAAFTGRKEYKSFGELIKEGVNGWGFADVEGLVGILGSLSCGEGVEGLARLREGALSEGRKGWDGEWEGSVGRMLGLNG